MNKFKAVLVELIDHLSRMNKKLIFVVSSSVVICVTALFAIASPSLLNLFADSSNNYIDVCDETFDLDTLTVTQSGKCLGINYSLYNNGLVVLTGEQNVSYISGTNLNLNGTIGTNIANGTNGVKYIYANFNPKGYGDSHLFSGLSKLEKIEFGSNFDPSQFVNADNLFNGCSSLKEIDLSFLNGTTTLTNMKGLFKNCTSLEKVNMSSVDFSVCSEDDLSDMFSGCTGLEVLKLNGATFGTTSIALPKDLYLWPDNKVVSSLPTSTTTVSYELHDTVKYICVCDETFDLEELTSVYSEKDTAMCGLEFDVYDNGLLYVRGKLAGNTLATFNFSTILGTNKSSIKYIYADYGTDGNQVSNYIFYGLDGLEKAAFGPNFDSGTKGIAQFSNLFENCTSLTDVDLRYFNVRACTTVKGMFSGCTSLKNVNSKGMKTYGDKLTDLSAMFYNCSALEELDLSGMRTDSVTDFSNVFRGCTHLKKLDISGWSLQSGQHADNFFLNCSSLEEIKADRSYFGNGRISIANTLYIWPNNTQDNAVSGKTVFNELYSTPHTHTWLDDDYMHICTYCNYVEDSTCEVTTMPLTSMFGIDVKYYDFGNHDGKDYKLILLSGTQTSSHTSGAAPQYLKDITGYDYLLVNFYPNKKNQNNLLSGANCVKEVTFGDIYDLYGVNSLCQMMSNMPNLTKVDMTRAQHASDVEHICNMFSNSGYQDIDGNNYLEIDFGNFDLSNVKCMAGMFYGTKAKKIDMSGVSLLRANNIGQLCMNSDIDELDLSGCDFRLINDTVDTHPEISGFTKGVEDVFTSSTIDKIHTPSAMGRCNYTFPNGILYVDEDNNMYNEFPLASKTLTLFTNYLIVSYDGNDYYFNDIVNHDTYNGIDYYIFNDGFMYMTGTQSADCSEYNLVNAAPWKKYPSATITTVYADYNINGYKQECMFKECPAVTIDLRNMNFAGSLSYQKAFYGANATNIYFPSTYSALNKITNLSDAFRYCTNLLSVDLSCFNFEDNTSLSCTFDGASNITSIVFGDAANFGKTTTMWQAFNNCSKLESIHFADPTNIANANYELDLSMCRDLKSAFQGCNSLNDLYWGKGIITSSQLEIIQYTFNGCSNLVEIDLGDKFDTSNVNNAEGFALNCSKLTTLSFLPASDTTHYVDMSSCSHIGSLVHGCSSLTTLNIGKGFKTTATLGNMRYMFNSCQNLTSFNCGDEFITTNVTNVEQMFAGCSRLTSLDLSSMNLSKVTNSYNFLNGTSALETFITPNKNPSTNYIFQTVSPMYDWDKYNQSYTSLPGSSRTLHKEQGHIVLATYNEKDYEVLDAVHHDKYCGIDYFIFSDGFMYMGGKQTAIAHDNDTELANRPWVKYTDIDIETIYVDFDSGTCTCVGQLFSECTTVKNYVTGTKFNLRNVNDFYRIFNSNTSLESIDLSNWNLNNAIDFSLMFVNCYNLTTIIFPSNINTSQVTDFSCMFELCENLTTITNLDKFDTSSATTMLGMFFGCKSLTNLNLSNFEINASNDDCIMLFDLFKYPEFSYFDMIPGFDASLLIGKDREDAILEIVRQFKLIYGTSKTDEEWYEAASVTYDNFGTDGAPYGETLSITLPNKLPTGFSYTLLTEYWKESVSGKRVLTLDKSYEGKTIVWNHSFYLGEIDDKEYYETDAVHRGKYLGIDYFIFDDGVMFLTGYQNEDSCYNNNRDYAPWKVHDDIDITTIYLNFTTLESGIEDLSEEYLFSGCSTVTRYIEGPDFKMGSIDDPIKSYECAFMDNIELESIDLTNWNMTSVNNISGMFSECRKLESVTFPSNINTSSVQDFSALFNNCYELTTINNLDKIRTTNGNDFAKMFFGCGNIATLDLSNFVFKTSITSGDVWHMLDTIFTPNEAGYANYLVDTNLLIGLNYDDTISEIVRQLKISYPSETDEACLEEAENLVLYNQFNNSPYGETRTIILPNSLPSGFSYTLPTDYWTESVSGNSVKTINNTYQGKTLVWSHSLSLGEIDGTEYYETDATYRGKYFGIDYFIFDDGVMFLTGNQTENSYWDNDTDNSFAPWKKHSDIPVTTVYLDYDANGFSQAFILRNLQVVTRYITGINFDLSNVTDFSYMFTNNASIVTLDLSNFNFNSTVNFGSFLSGCMSLQTVTFPSDIDTSNVTDFGAMFTLCTYLTTINNLDEFDTSNGTNFDSMFDSCTMLGKNTPFDISFFKISSSATYQDMLTIVKYPNYDAVEMSSFIPNPRDYIGLSESEFIETAYNDIYQNFPGYTEDVIKDSLRLFYGMYFIDYAPYGETRSIILPNTLPSNFSYKLLSDYWTESVSGNKVTTLNNSYAGKTITWAHDLYLGKVDDVDYYENNALYKGRYCGVDYFIFDDGMLFLTGNQDRNCSITINQNRAPWVVRSDAEITKVYADYNPNGYGQSYMFYFDQNDESEIEKIIFGEHYNSTNVLDMSHMFENNQLLQEIVFNDTFITSSVTNMDQMFDTCLSLSEIDLSKFDTSNVKTAKEMFEDCSSLEELDLSNCDFSNLDYGTNYNADQLMFNDCDNLKLLKTPKKTSSAMQDNTLPYAMYDYDNHTSYTSLPKNANQSITLHKTPEIKFTVDGNDYYDTKAKYKGKYLGIDYYIFNDGVLVLTGDQTEACSDIKNYNYSPWKKHRDITIKKIFADYNAHGYSQEYILSFDDENARNYNPTFDITSNVEKIFFGDNFNSTGVTSMYAMFENNVNVASIDFGNHFDTSSVTNMQEMFFNNGSLINLNISFFDTRNVENMLQMFAACYELINLTLPEHFVTAKTTLIDMMFEACFELTSIDFDAFDTSNVISASYMFDYCESLTEIDLSNWDFSKLKYDDDDDYYADEMMFVYCTSLEILKTPKKTNGLVQDDTLPCTMYDYVTHTAYTSFPEDATSSITLHRTPEIKFTVDGNDYYDTEATYKGKYCGIDYYVFSDGLLILTGDQTCDCTKALSQTDAPWRKLNSGDLITKIYADYDTHGFSQSHMFYFDFHGNPGIHSSVEKIIFGDDYDSSNVEDMTSMFENCNELTEIIFNDGFDTSSVTNMSNMFMYLYEMEELDISSFDTSKVENMESMFSNSEGLVTLTLPKPFITDKTIIAELLFDYCINLTEIDLSGSDTSSLKDACYMFEGCSSLTELDLSTLDFSSLEVYNNPSYTSYWADDGMFSGCTSLETLKTPLKTNGNLYDNTLPYPMYDYDNHTSYTSLPKNATSSITLHSVPQYVVTFDSLGGSAVADMYVLSGETYDTLPVPTKLGYTFDAWHLGSNTGQVVSSDDTVTGDHTLYASYTENSYTVKFNANDRTNTSVNMSDETFTYTESKALSSNTYEKVYSVSFDTMGGDDIDAISCTYTFKEWVDKDAPSKTYSDAQVVSGLRTDNNAVVNLNAVWNDGSITLPLPNNPGHTFTGWYLLDDTNVGMNGETYTATSDVLLYAKYDTINYTVSFDTDGGNSISNRTNYNYNDRYDALGALPVPVKTGYTFEAWHLDSVSGAEVSDSDLVTDSHTLYASYTANTYQVTLDADGGAVSPASITVTYGSTYGLLPVPLKPGNEFKGWFVSKTLGADEVKDTTVVTNTSDHTIYAQWIRDVYHVTLHPEGGSCASNTTNYYYGAPIGTLEVPTKEGYTFTGWHKDSVTGDLVNSETSVTSNLDLYASYTENSYTVTFNANDRTNTSVVMSDETFTYTESKALSSNTYEKVYNVSYDTDGGNTITSDQCTYTFKEWVDQDDPSKTYSNAQVVSGLRTDNNAVVNLNAVWNDGYITLPLAISAGHTFTGWYLLDNTYVGKNGDTYKAEGDVTLYAKYDTINYTVTFDTNSAVICPQISKAYGAQLGAALPTPTRTGYKFGGWFLDEDGDTFSNEVTSTYVMPDHDIIVHAKWTPISYKVVFDGNGNTNTDASLSDKVLNYDESYVLPSNPFEIKYVVHFNDSDDNKVAEDMNIIYTFLGWEAYNGDTALALPLISDTATISNLTDIDNSTVTLKAKYELTSISLPNATKVGHSFSGWYNSKDFSNISNKVGIENTSYSTSSDTTLYAAFNANALILTFESNGGTSIYDREDVHYGDTYGSLLQGAITKTGYDFEGWHKDINLNDTKVESTDVIIESHTLYAKWIPHTYEVKFIGTNKTNDVSMVNESFTYGEEKELSSNIYERKFKVEFYDDDSLVETKYIVYDFDKWIDQDNNINTYVDGQRVSNLTSINNGVISLESTWKVGSNTKVMLDNTHTTKTGKDFMGWYSDKDTFLNKLGMGGEFINEDGLINEDIKVYAYFKTCAYHVSLDSNGGTTFNDLGRDANEEYDLPIPNKLGYTFGGWYSDNNTFSNKVESTDIVTGDITLYAKWDANHYFIHFEPNGAQGIMLDQELIYDDIAKNISKNNYTKSAKVSYETYGAGIIPDSDLTFVFDGWTNSLSTKEKIYNDEDLVRNILSDNNDILNLYALWSGDIMLPSVSKSNYTFDGWYLDDTYLTKVGNAGDRYIPSGDLMLYAKFTEIKNNNDNDDDDKHHGQTITVGGYSLSTLANGIYNTNDTVRFIEGYYNDYFRPNGTITRAEISAIFARINAYYDDNKDYNNSLTKYSDMSGTHWYNNYIGYLTNINVFKGYTNDTFKPERNMTRGEFSKAVAEYLNIDIRNAMYTNCNYTDIEGKWYENYVKMLTSYGYLKGYKDGSFNGDKYITRAEVCNVINKILKQNGHTNDYSNRTYKDVKKSQWFYNDVMIASYLK